MTKETITYNPHAVSHLELKNKNEKLISERNLLHKNSIWFGLTNSKELDDNLEKEEKEEKDLVRTLSEVENQFIEVEKDLKIINCRIKTKLNPLNFFSKAQRKFRNERKEIEGKLTIIEETKIKLHKKHKQTKSKKLKIKNDINRFQSFDFNSTNEKLRRIEKNIATNAEEIEKLKILKDLTDMKLKPFLDQLKRMESKRNIIYSELNQAINYNEQLNNASNPRDRAMIHQNCQANLGNGKPQQIIQNHNKELVVLDRSIKKLKLRAKNESRKASMVINTVIIDGNNLCYENGDNYVGIKPCLRVASELSQKFNIIVIFDSQIRSMLQLDDNRIKSKFSDNVKVHIVANKKLADETILDLSSNNLYNYVISNDKFIDYFDKEVINNGRIIRHEIIDDKIFIHDLDLNINYN